MKWIGQHIWDFISRFRNDVYLEDLTESTQDHVVGIDAAGKLYKQDVSTGDMTGVDITVGTGLDISQSNTTGGDYTSTINLDLTEVGVSGSANQLLTDDGDGTVTSESGLKFSGNVLTVDGLNDVKITSSTNGLGYTPDVISTAANIIGLSSYNVFGTGVGGLLEQQDFTSGSVSGAATAWKGGGGYGTNKSGGDMHVIAGRGTGSKPGGSFKFWSSPAGSSGSSYNTSAVKFIIDSVGNITSYGNLTFVGGGDGIIFEGTTPDDHETTFLAGEPTADRTITLPDATGTVALTSDIPDETVSTGSFISKQVKVTLSQANCNSLHAIPRELIPAQGANTIIVPAGGILMVDRGGAQNNTAADLNFHYADKEPGNYGQTVLFHLRRFMYGNATDIIYSLGELSGFEISQNLTDCVNKSLEVSVDSALTNNSMTSITIYLTYHVIDIS